MAIQEDNNVQTKMNERQLFVEEDDGRSFRKATTDETREARLVEQERQMLYSQREAIEKRLRELSQHPSKVFYDEPGYLADLRHFIASGKVDMI